MKPVVLLNLLSRGVEEGLATMAPFLASLVADHPLFVLSQAGETVTEDLLERRRVSYDGLLLDGDEGAATVVLERLGYGPVLTMDIGQEGDA
ncbi:hypothetical protein [Azospirillum argentinense]|uniref:hypothetical protein n=1 Tax=Azospirillum argentinense TaxID=2970906 RepID=UPI0032DF7FBA